MKKIKLWNHFLKDNIYGSQCKYKTKSYCLRGRKYTENINPEVSSSSNGRAMILSKCAISNSKKSRFIKNQESKGLLSKLGIKTSLSKIQMLGNIFVLNGYVHIKMNKIVNKSLLARDKFMPEIHLKQLGFTYSACGRFSENKEAIQKFK